ncbi:MAG: hypothetical protein PHF31_14750 [Methylobacter sp.]|nr:hypothetical protein [Methylobacter sp.]
MDPILAFAKNPGALSDLLKALGAEIQIGNLHDIDDVRLAHKDVQRVYFCAPLLRNALNASTVFAATAQEHKLGSILNHI